MKKKQWAQSFSLIDEKYVEEADPMRDAGRVSAVRRLRRRIITLAACAAAVLLGLILFIPYRTEVPDVSRYADSEYYAVIQRLNDGQVIKPRYRNNLDYLLSKTLSKTDMDNMNTATGGTGTANDGGTRPETGAYRETTDNQKSPMLILPFILKESTTDIHFLVYCTVVSPHIVFQFILIEFYSGSQVSRHENTFSETIDILRSCHPV